MADIQIGKRQELQMIVDVRGKGAAKTLERVLASAERKARLSRRERLLIVEQALVLMEMTYVHLPMKRAIHAVDPIQQLKLLRSQLAHWNNRLESPIDFHRRLLAIFASMRDLHTLYLLPRPYRDYTAYLPFLIERCFERGRERFIVTRTTASSAPGTDDATGARFEPGVEVLCWNGVPIKRAIEINGDTQAGSNAAARFARGLDNLTIRPLNGSLPPDERWVDIQYRPNNKKGVEATHRAFWLAQKSVEAAGASSRESKKRVALDVKRTRILEVKKTLYRRDKGADADLGAIEDVLFAQKKTLGGQQLGYIRIFSFDVGDTTEFVKRFVTLITRDDFPQDGLILDVRGNPGGNIRAAESLLQLFTPRRIVPESFEFINTQLNYQVCRCAPEDWDLKRWLPSIRDSVLTGETYSRGFPMTSDKRCNGIGQVYHGPVVLITDALSYSATDIFAAGFQDNEVGVVLGTDGNTGAGGANFWSLGDLMHALKKYRKSPFRTLPRGAEMFVAMRRSIRVGRRAGNSLEEFGVRPDERHRMTRRDLLGDNADLLAKAATIIRRQPYYTLSVKPAIRRGTRRIVVSAASKRSSSRAGAAISHVDVYVNNRPVRSVDARTGSVESALVTLGAATGRSVSVEVRAWDQADRLVAVRRLVVGGTPTTRRHGSTGG